MKRNNIRRGGVQKGRDHCSGRFQGAPKEELKVSTKVASPGFYLLQEQTDMAYDVAVWRNRLGVMANGGIRDEE